jgi:hypothetical protein
MSEEENPNQLYAGTLASVFYEFCHFLDELGHLLNLDGFVWFYRFCQWAHRKD